MGNILDDYKNQLETDRLNENNIVPDENETEYDKAVRKKINEINNDPNDMEVVYNTFQKEFPRIPEHDFDTDGGSKIEEGIRICIKHVYCPKCGKELVSKSPVMYNPFTLEKVAKHECECGFKANLEHAYPRLMYVNSLGEEIKAFAD